MFNKLTLLIPIQYKDLQRPLKGRSYGSWIVIDNKYKNDKGLLAHERVHARQFLRFAIPSLFIACILYYLQQYYIAPIFLLTIATHSILYKFNMKYRYKTEIEAYGYSLVSKNRTKLSVYNVLSKYYNVNKEFLDKNFIIDINKAIENAKKDYKDLIK